MLFNIPLTANGNKKWTAPFGTAQYLFHSIMLLVTVDRGCSQFLLNAE